MAIEQAKGVISERAALTMDEAFARLRTHARSHNLKLISPGRLPGRAHPPRRPNVGDHRVDPQRHVRSPGPPAGRISRGSLTNASVSAVLPAAPPGWLVSRQPGPRAGCRSGRAWWPENTPQCHISAYLAAATE
ncbi:MAG: ANTAR domain-containing protein [Actinomycetota bacterium]|nr:ANTAR domain-containing protein [Actinomycetota bacterium]